MKDLTNLWVDNWIQMWDSNPLWVTENPKSRPLGDGVSKTKENKGFKNMHKEKKIMYWMRLKIFKRLKF